MHRLGIAHRWVRLGYATPAILIAQAHVYAWASRMLEWDDLRLLLAIAWHAGLTAAARVLGVTQPTMGRPVEQMENRLATQLFKHTGTGALSTLSRSLLPLAGAKEQTAQAAARNTGLDGTARTTTPEWTGHHFWFRSWPGSAACTPA